MNDQVLKVENISKQYRLGVINTGTLSRDIESFVARKIGIEDPNSSIVGENNLKNLGKDYNKIWALNDINIIINKGEKVGVIGKNGSGKSTLLKIISRITAPTKGRVFINGRIASLLEVGTGFHPELTGKENIYLNGSILGMAKIEIDKNLNRIIDFSGIGQYIDTPIKRYSSGMKVRLGFAVAVHLQMETLLIDEVLAVGDYNFQKRSIEKMNRSADEGKTILFVSHNMDAIRKLCDRVIVLDKGTVIYDGKTEEGIVAYLNINNKRLSNEIMMPKVRNSFGYPTKLGFLNSNNEQNAEIKLFETWAIILEFEMIKPLENVIAAIGVFTTSGVGLVTYWSKAKDLDKGQYRVKFNCNLKLQVTDLTFAIGLTSHDLSFYYEDGIGMVRISEESISEMPYVSKGGGLLLSSQKEIITPLP
jgi:lipopolysaccharide transport system ATP-binding protein